MELVRFIHLLGSALWIGGAIAAMTVALGAKNEPVEVRAGAFRLLSRVHTMVVGLGALLAVASGLLLTMWLVTRGAGDALSTVRMSTMQGAGLVGGLMVLFVGVPTAVRLGGLAMPDENGNLPPAFETLRKRQAIVQSVAGGLAVFSMFAWAVL